MAVVVDVAAGLELADGFAVVPGLTPVVGRVPAEGFVVGFFVRLVTGVRDRVEGVFEVGLFAGALLVGRDVLPPIIPPPVTPPSCCPAATPAQTDRTSSVNTN